MVEVGVGEQDRVDPEAQLLDRAEDALGLSAVMLAMYVPMGYYIDRFMYRRRLRQLQAARAAKKQQG